MRFLGALLVFAACHSDGGMSPGADASPDGPPIDTPVPPTVGLWVTWRADPALPGDVDGKITVTDATFQMDRLQVIGDAGIDARTTHSKYVLAWNAEGKPAQERFPEAPVGVYSKILAVMAPAGPGANAYEIHGTWRDGGSSQPIPFEIRDRLLVNLSIDCDEELPAAGSAMLGIEVDLKDALNTIKFEDIMPTGGVLEVEGPQLMQFRDRLKKAFKLDENDD
jgi:hypothetical protein